MLVNTVSVVVIWVYCCCRPTFSRDERLPDCYYEAEQDGHRNLCEPNYGKQCPTSALDLVTLRWLDLSKKIFHNGILRRISLIHRYISRKLLVCLLSAVDYRGFPKNLVTSACRPELAKNERFRQMPTSKHPKLSRKSWFLLSWMLEINNVCYGQIFLWTLLNFVQWQLAIIRKSGKNISTIRI